MFLEEKNLEIVKEILQRIAPNAEVRAFGSRVTGKHLKKFSDLDLALNSKNGEKISEKIMMRLRHEFEESNLPIRVDVLDLNDVSENFAKIINENYEIIK